MKHIVGLPFCTFDKQNRYLPQDLAKSRTGDVAKENNSEVIGTDIEDEKLNGVTGALAAPSDEAPAETPKRGENSEAMVQQENIQGKFQRCKARIDSDGNFETVESSELCKSMFF